VIVTNYDKDIVEFYCENCDFKGFYDVSNLVKEDCAIDIDIVCEFCGAATVLYVVKCKDPARAKELNAQIGAMRLKRRSEV